MSQNLFDSYGQDYLSELNKAYQEAEVNTRASLLPEGKYQAHISYVSLNHSKIYPDEIQLGMVFTVLNGDQKGLRASKYTPVTIENLGRLKSDLTVLGIDLGDDISQLGNMEILDAILDQIVDITVRHKKRNDGKGVYQNIYINRSMGKNGENAGINGFTEVADDDELPFA